MLLLHDIKSLIFANRGFQHVYIEGIVRILHEKSVSEIRENSFASIDSLSQLEIRRDAFIYIRFYQSTVAKFRATIVFHVLSVDWIVGCTFVVSFM